MSVERRVPPFVPDLGRIARGWAVTVGLIGGLGAQDETIGFDGAVVSLPPFFVEPTDGATWLRVTLPGFELITTHDRSFAQKFAQAYLEQSHILSEFVPARYLWQPHLPETYVVVDATGKRADPDEVVNQIIRQNRASPRHANRRERFLPNLRLSSPDSSITLGFMDGSDLDPSAPPVSPALPRWGLAPYPGPQPPPGFRFSTRRLGHHLTHRAPALPVWFIAGLINVYDRAQFLPGRTVLEPLPAIELPPPARESNETSTAFPLAPLIEHPAPTDTEALAAWTRTAELLVRWCLFADRGIHRPALWSYLDRVVLEAPDEALFHACFGLSFADTETQLREFYQTRAIRRFTLPRTNHPPSPVVEVHPARRTDVARILAEWERLETQHVQREFPHLHDTYLTRARRTIASARQHHHDSPALAAVAGLLEYSAGNLDEAESNLATALAQGVTRPLALRTLARIRYQRLGDDRPLTADSIRPIVELLVQAHERPPAMSEVYLDLAEVWAAAEAPLGRPEIGILAAGVRGFPRELPLITAMVLMQVDRGRSASAHQVLRYARDRAANQARVGVLEQLESRLRGIPPSE